MTDIVRVLRILEYVGPREWVETTLEKGAVPANGSHRIDDNKVIRSATLGEFPEVLLHDQEWKYGSCETVSKDNDRTWKTPFLRDMLGSRS
jgi:hypothetical protein